MSNRQTYVLTQKQYHLLETSLIKSNNTNAVFYEEGEFRDETLVRDFKLFHVWGSTVRLYPKTGSRVDNNVRRAELRLTGRDFDNCEARRILENLLKEPLVS